MPLFGKKPERTPYVNPLQYRVIHGNDDMLRSEGMFAVQVAAPFIIAVCASFITMTMSFLPQWAPMAVFGISVIIGYVILDRLYTSVTREAGSRPIFITLVYESRNMRWANYFIPLVNPVPLPVLEEWCYRVLGVPEGSRIMNRVPETAVIGRLNRNQFMGNSQQTVTQLEGTRSEILAIKRRVYPYIMTWKNLGHVLPWCIWEYPAPQEISIQDMQGRKAGGTFDFVQTQIMFKNFFVTVPFATNAVIVFRKYFKWPDEKTGELVDVPVYSVEFSDWHCEQVQGDMYVPNLPIGAVNDTIAEWALQELGIAKQDIASKDVRINELKDALEKSAELRDEEGAQIADNLARSRKALKTKIKKSLLNDPVVWLAIIGFCVAIFGAAYFLGQLPIHP